jgi:hypothetical protein
MERTAGSSFSFLHYTLFPQECRSSDLFDGWIASLLFVAIVYGYLGRMLLPCGNNPKGMLAFRIQFKYIIKNFHLPCTPVVLSCAIRTTSEVDLEHRDSGNSGSLAAAHACKCIDYHVRLSRNRASRLTVWRLSNSSSLLFWTSPNSPVLCLFQT